MNGLLRHGATGVAPFLIAAIGVALVIGKIHADGEPGGIPVLLALFGVGWHLVRRLRARSRRE